MSKKLEIFGDFLLEAITLFCVIFVAIAVVYAVVEVFFLVMHSIYMAISEPTLREALAFIAAITFLMTAARMALWIKNKEWKN